MDLSCPASNELLSSWSWCSMLQSQLRLAPSLWRKGLTLRHSGAGGGRRGIVVPLS